MCIRDRYGLVIKSVSNYCGVESSTIKYNFYLDEENNMKPVITVRLKAVDLNEKIKSIEAAMGEDTVDESSMSLEEYRTYKIKQYGAECQDKIYAGTDVETSYGTEHFSATGDDQANIKTLSDVAMATKYSLPYHADGSQCKVCLLYTSYIDTATNSIDRGMPVEEIKEILGHVKLDTTLIYAKVSKENIKHDHRKYII